MTLQQTFKELSVFNRITFVEKNHSYLLDGHSTNCLSVTRLIKKFKREFDKQKNAERVAKKTNRTVDEVLLEWDMNNLRSTTLGSMLHKYIENFYCNKRVEFEGKFEGLRVEEKKNLLETLPTLIRHFHSFYNDNKHLICVKNEMVLGDIEDTKICGMMDMLAFNLESNAFEILDFKTNKKMDKTSPWGNLYSPFEHMTEGEVNEYTIQLNCYKYFIEKYTSIKIDKLKLVWLHSSNDNYKVIELENIQTKIRDMFEQFKETSLKEKI